MQKKETEKKETAKAADTVEKKPAETEKEAEKKREQLKTTKTDCKATKTTKRTYKEGSCVRQLRNRLKRQLPRRRQ